MQRGASCRSRRELSSEYLVAKIRLRYSRERARSSKRHRGAGAAAPGFRQIPHVAEVVRQICQTVSVYMNFATTKIGSGQSGAVWIYCKLQVKSTFCFKVCSLLVMLFVLVVLVFTSLLSSKNWQPTPSHVKFLTLRGVLNGGVWGQMTGFPFS